MANHGQAYDGLDFQVMMLSRDQKCSDSWPLTVPCMTMLAQNQQYSDDSQFVVHIRLMELWVVNLIHVWHAVKYTVQHLTTIPYITDKHFINTTLISPSTLVSRFHCWAIAFHTWLFFLFWDTRNYLNDIMNIFIWDPLKVSS